MQPEDLQSARHICIGHDTLQFIIGDLACQDSIHALLQPRERHDTPAENPYEVRDVHRGHGWS